MLRDRLESTLLCALTLALAVLGGRQAQASPAPAPLNAEATVDLYPQANELREVLDLSGLWDFKLTMNHKGVFTRQREPKMAAHFLRQRWAGK